MNPKHTNVMKIMPRRYKDNNHVYLLLLDTYNPKTDTLDYIDLTTSNTHLGRYHGIQSKSTAYTITDNSPDDIRVCSILSRNYNSAVPVYLSKFSNPNRVRQAFRKW